MASIYLDKQGQTVDVEPVRGFLGGARGYGENSLESYSKAIAEFYQDQDSGDIIDLSRGTGGATYRGGYSGFGGVLAVPNLGRRRQVAPKADEDNLSRRQLKVYQGPTALAQPSTVQPQRPKRGSGVNQDTFDQLSSYAGGFGDSFYDRNDTTRAVERMNSLVYQKYAQITPPTEYTEEEEKAYLDDYGSAGSYDIGLYAYGNLNDQTPNTFFSDVYGNAPEIAGSTLSSVGPTQPSPPPPSRLRGVNLGSSRPARLIADREPDEISRNLRSNISGYYSDAGF